MYSSSLYYQFFVLSHENCVHVNSLSIGFLSSSCCISIFVELRIALQILYLEYRLCVGQSVSFVFVVFACNRFYNIACIVTSVFSVFVL